MTRTNDEHDEIADRLRRTFDTAAGLAPTTLRHPVGAAAPPRRRSTPRVLVAAATAAILIPATVVTVHAIRTQPTSPAVTTTTSTPTGHPPTAPDMPQQATFGRPIGIYNLTGTASAQITVMPLTRRVGTHLVADVTMTAVTGSWEPAAYQFRVDSDRTRKQYVADPDVKLDGGNPLPLDVIDQGRTVSGDVVFDAPSGQYSFVVSICPDGTRCYDLALWTTQP